MARDGMALTPPTRPAWVVPALTGTLAAIALLAVLADGYFYRNTANGVVVWIVIGVVGLSWCAELATRRQPVWLLAAAQLTAVGCLALLRRADVAPLFLMVLIAWVSYTRTRRESALLLGCVLGFFWLGTPTLSDGGALQLTGWYSWPIALLWACALVPVWISVRGHLRQQKLVLALRAAQTDLARQAASDERRRIAREIHDVVAHSLTVTMLHLTAARYILSRDPAGAAAALADAERLGRQSLADVRRTVGLLAAEGVGNSTPLAPLPGAEDIPTLVADYARAGLDAHYTRSGEVLEVPPAAGLALYRIAQEALANVAKHARGAHVSVRLRTEPDVLLEVSDDGVHDAVDPDSLALDAGPGLGLVGMRQRALLLGGTLTAGPTDNGCGWSVECRLPGTATAR